MSFHEENTKDISICEELKKIRPNIFAKGGDRHSGNIPETPVCEEIGCLIVNEIGHGGKVQSSSWLVKQAKDNTEKLNTRKKTKK
jgi:D-beta-D-heptose 7-phosphate kinase/D-beta-D-heptose 1-phosphate adenosyltransferase